MSYKYKINLLITLFVLLLTISCAKQVELSADEDQSPPDVGVLVNYAPLQDIDETQVIKMTLAENIQLQGTAVDEESGIRYVTVGTSLTYKCLDKGEVQLYSGGGEWSNHNDYPGKFRNKRVSVNQIATHNFRLIYLRKQCERDEVLLNAEGEIYVSARNYFGKTNERTYKVIFELADPYN
ncbi:MAG: hypothetical protein ACR2NW_09995 [Thermodesulfobacteriota bacterium]